MSSGGQITFKITAEEANALAALGRVVQAQEASSNAAMRTAAAYRQVAAEERALVREAGKIREAVATPVEQYHRELEKLKTLLGSSKISQDEYNRAIEQANARYVQAVQSQAASTESAKARAAAEAEAARQVQQASQQAAKIKDQVRTAEERHAAEVAELAEHLDAGRLSQDEYTRAVEQSRARLDEATGAMARHRQQQAAAAKVTEAVRTAEERYGQEIAELDALLSENRISQEQYNRAVQQSRERLDDATGAAARHRKAEQDAARVIEQVRTPTERYNATLTQLKQHLNENRISQEQYNRAVAEADDKLKAAAASGDEAFGSKMVGNLASYAIGLASAAVGVGAISQALSDVQQTSREAAEEARRSRMGVGALAQVAESPEEFQSLTGKAKQFFAGGGAESLDAAARTVFEVKSAGQMEFLDLFRELRAAGVIETPDTLATAATTISTSMGKEETGTIRDIISKAFGAAAFSPGSVEGLLEAAARGGGSARALRLSDEELLATTATLATTTGSPSEGGTMMANLFKQLDRLEREQGVNLGGTLAEKIKTMESQGGATGERYVEFFRDEQALRGYRDLAANLPQYEQALTGIAKAGATDEVGRKLTFHKADPSIVAARRAEEAKAAEMLSRERLGIFGNVNDEFVDSKTKEWRDQGAHELLIAANRRVYGAQRWMWGEESFARSKMGGEEVGVNVGGYGPFSNYAPGPQRVNTRATDSMADIATKLDRQTKIAEQQLEQTKKLVDGATRGRLGNPDRDR